MTREIKIGSVAIGGANPVAIQSMLNIPLADTKRAIDQAKRLSDAGCRIIRAAVPDMENAEALKEFIASCPMPVVADIHFDYRLAIAAIRAGVDKVRINPGNIGEKSRVRAVCEELKSHDIPVRIGVNSGSVEAELLKKYSHPCAEALIESAERSIACFNEFNYDNIVISIKSSNVKMTYDANMAFSQKYDYPLHLGITESGFGDTGLVASSIGIGSLLINGVGDTIRVSLTDDPIAEIAAAKEILSALDLRHEGVKVISCPTCGRTKTDIMPIVRALKEKTADITQPVTIAVMGCVVNGPGEAREADFGVACGVNEGLLFRNGETVEKIPAKDILDRLLAETDCFINKGKEAES